MSNSGPAAKKRKFQRPQKNNKYNHSKLRFLQPDIRGFLVTCNFREKDCVRECYNILNEYAGEWIEESTSTTEDSAEGKSLTETVQASTANSDSDDSDSDDEPEDISSQLENEIQSGIKSNAKKRRTFQQVDTGTPNCLFIKTNLKDPVGFGVKIVRDLAETKISKTRFLLRFLPIEKVCRSNLDDIKNSAGQLFDKYFLNTTPKTFSIIVNKRYNNNVDRMGIIKELADIVTFKSNAHKVDLSNPQVTIVVEIIKGLCCLAVVPDYLQLKKYNLAELCEKRGGAAKKVEAKEGEPTKEETTGGAEKKEVEEAPIDAETAPVVVTTEE